MRFKNSAPYAATPPLENRAIVATFGSRVESGRMPVWVLAGVKQPCLHDGEHTFARVHRLPRSL